MPKPWTIQLAFAVHLDARTFAKAREPLTVEQQPSRLRENRIRTPEPDNPCPRRRLLNELGLSLVLLRQLSHLEKSSHLNYHSRRTTC